MTTLHFQTTILEDGKIPLVLPESLRGKMVKLNVSLESTEQISDKTVSPKGILALKGILKGYSMEELEEAKNEYLKKK
ncbi:MAG: hypothetical protein LBQ50_08985 [Planctomycetaceae bacterium]|jgi:hypothetical protein|nr:hypothetical protein [Planctomycetaceae bacterium]